MVCYLISPRLPVDRVPDIRLMPDFIEQFHLL
jgi:hypothetical protein